MSKKITINRKVKTISGRHESKLNKEVTLHLEEDGACEALTKLYTSPQPTYEETLHDFMKSETAFVVSFLEDLGLPSDELKKYTVEYDIENDILLIDGICGKKFGATFSEKFKALHKLKKERSTGKLSITLAGLLSEWFSHIAGVDHISNFFISLDMAKGFLKKGNVKECSIWCIGATIESRNIYIAKYEDYEISQGKRQYKTREKELYMLRRWAELEKEDVSLNSASPRVSL